MKKYRMMEIGLIVLIDLVLLRWLGPSFSVVFTMITVWMLYGIVILKRLSRQYKVSWLATIYKIYTLGMILFLISFIGIESYVVCEMANYQEVDSLEPYEYVVVLGAGLKGEQVSRTLQLRLDEAVKYYELHPEVEIIVSGGQGPDEVISEAEAMGRYLIQEGVDPEHIVKEAKSTTTVENIRFSKEVIQQRSHDVGRFIIVTSDYHLPRARMIAAHFGIQSEGLASKSPLLVRLNYMVREYPSTILDFIKLKLGKEDMVWPSWLKQF